MKKEKAKLPVFAKAFKIFFKTQGVNIRFVDKNGKEIKN